MSPAIRKGPSLDGWWARSAATMLRRPQQPVTIISAYLLLSRNRRSAVGSAAEVTRLWDVADRYHPRSC